VQSGWAVGWGVAVGLFVLTQSLFPPQTGRRVLFALGVLPALGVFWVRRHVPEPDVFVRHTDRPDGRPSFLGIFRPGLLRTTVVCALLCTGAQGGYYSLTTFLPQFLRSARGLDVLGIGGKLLLVIVGALAGYLFLGLGALLTEQYPTELRGSGQGYCYKLRPRDRRDLPAARRPAGRRDLDRGHHCRVRRDRPPRDGALLAPAAGDPRGRAHRHGPVSSRADTV
jgi:hypothetical protein